MERMETREMTQPTLIQMVREAWPKHQEAASQAYETFVDYCGLAPCRVPGMDTVLRLAVRIEAGRNVEEAAAKEYIYRWNLALQSPVFGIPHTLGL